MALDMHHGNTMIFRYSMYHVFDMVPRAWTVVLKWLFEQVPWSFDIIPWFVDINHSIIMFFFTVPQFLDMQHGNTMFFRYEPFQ